MNLVGGQTLTGSGNEIFDYRQQDWWVRITGQLTSTNQYSFTSINPADAPAFGTNFSPSFSPAGGVHTWEGCAYELNGSTTVATGTIVKATPAGTNWVFSSPAAGGSLTHGTLYNAYPAFYGIGSSGTWLDTSGTFGTLALPAAGTYLLCGQMCATGQLSAVTDAYVMARVFDVTAGADVPGSGFICLSATGISSQVEGSGAFSAIYTTTGARTLRWDVLRSGGATWSSSYAGAAQQPDVAPALNYVKIA